MTPIVQTIVLALTDVQRWTWRAVLALTLIVIAYIVPRLVSTSLGVQDILDTGNLIGAGLLALEVARARQQTPPPPTSPSERGLAVIAVLKWLTILLIIALAVLANIAIHGCGSREVVTRDPISIEYWQGPPCRVHILAGDAEPYIVRNPKGSPLQCFVVEP